MDMSKAYTPPTQPRYSESDETHPRFPEYLRYRAAMSAQLVTGDSFPRWIESVEQSENGFTSVFEVTSLEAKLKPGWYKNVFGPGRKLKHCHGPFSAQAISEATL